MPARFKELPLYKSVRSVFQRSSPTGSGSGSDSPDGGGGKDSPDGGGGGFIDGSDYINANFVSGYKDRKMWICAQAR